MSEAAVLARTSNGPITQERLHQDLTNIGLKAGMTLMVHTALSRIGWGCGGAQTLIAALLDAIGPNGNLVMSAQSPQLSDPQHWSDPPVPETWWETIRQNHPPFDACQTPTSRCGVVPEAFRLWPGTRRSSHPLVSLCAKGPAAEMLLADQPLHDPLGEASPLAKLEKLNALILMIGCGWETCTALHLAERRALPNAPRFSDGAPVIINGERQWISINMPLMDSETFVPVGQKIDGQSFMQHGHIGESFARFFPLQAASQIAEKLLRVS
uniref:aminoglycoside N(3)-acetyltransferase n=1 Tax=Neokomagataea thailandica TaxID=661190 RepID=UPI002265BADA|nr:AAC(3) family N-acetyltransferase [Neokomagataea thailandica]